MRILNVTQAYYPFHHRGGPAFKIRSISRALVEQGHQATVLTADLGLTTEQGALSEIVQDCHGWRSTMDGVDTIYLKTCGHYRSLTLNPGVVGFCRQALRNFDLVHIYGLYDLLGPTVARYCRAFDIPYFVEPLGMTRPIDRGFLLKRIWNKLVGRYLESACQIVATSDQEMNELLADGFLSKKLVLRYNGVDLEEFRNLPPRGSFRAKAGIREDERFIIFLGRLIPRKGANLLIEALPQLERETTKLVIAGPDGEAGYSAFLRRKAHDLGVKQRVLFTGPLYGTDKRAALADADIFALPSRYENFGNAAAEAIACGTPALVTDRCGIAPLINHRAGLVTSYTAAGVAEGLRSLEGNATEYQRLKAGCAAVANEISWTRIVQGMQISYEHAKADFLRCSSV